jgi:hypothetical protein
MPPTSCARAWALGVEGVCGVALIKPWPRLK